MTVARACCAGLALLGVLAGCSEPPVESEPEQQAASGLRFLSETESEGFARAMEPREFDFPSDHGSHDEYQSEWWYFTGNLETDAGRHFGFELTFFRFAFSAERSDRRSDWGANQAWMGHFAVTDTDGGEFIAEERFSRQALGLSGTQREPFRVWLEDWSATGESTQLLPLELVAGGERTAIRLTILDGKAPVRNGEAGLDPKGPERGNASYYYSMTRMQAGGTLSIDGVDFDVAGSVWMDREWGTSSLSTDLAGWDWFGLQLSDGRDLMYYRLRTAEGDSSRFSGGSIVNANGERTYLSVDDVMLEPVDYWTSPTTQSTYPVSWELTVPADGLTLSIEPVLQQQELSLSVRYWEGAVRIEGSRDGDEITGVGYAELTGY